MSNGAVQVQNITDKDLHKAIRIENKLSNGLMVHKIIKKEKNLLFLFFQAELSSNASLSFLSKLLQGSRQIHSGQIHKFKSSRSKGKHEGLTDERCWPTDRCVSSDNLRLLFRNSLSESQLLCIAPEWRNGRVISEKSAEKML